jgi:DNA-binding response OmpR family regulator
MYKSTPWFEVPANGGQYGGAVLSPKELQEYISMIADRVLCTVYMVKNMNLQYCGNSRTAGYGTIDKIKPARSVYAPEVSMAKILLVEDDKSIVMNLTEFLQSEGFSVNTAGGQKTALEKITDEPYDLILLDISLPDGNGYAVCSAAKSIRNVPVIFLTASGDEYSVVTGLEMGADDYVSKPFRPRELLSRIRNVLRRNGRQQQALEYGGVKIDTVKGTVTKNGADVFLSALEYRLLLIFFNNRGVLLTRAKLMDEIWDIAGEFVNDNTLTVYIKRLREKIEDDPQEPSIIKTVRGLGYKLGD